MTLLSSEALIGATSFPLLLAPGGGKKRDPGNEVLGIGINGQIILEIRDNWQNYF